MPILVRKIRRAQWEKSEKHYLQNEDFSADSITSGLKTDKDSLSFWLIEDNQRCNLEQIVLAMATGFNSSDTIDLVWIDSEVIEANQLKCTETPGNTNYKEFVNNHRSMCELTYKKLGVLASLIDESIRNEKIARFNQRELKEIVGNALDKGVITESDLTGEFLSKIRSK